MPSHLLVNKRLLVRAEVTNQSLGDVIFIDLVAELSYECLALVPHLFDFALRGSRKGEREWSEAILLSKVVLLYVCLFL